MDPKIDRYGSITNDDKSATWLKEKLSTLEFEDTWRVFNEDKLGYTWRKAKPKMICSRLDYIICNQALLQFFDTVEIIPGYRSDHSMVLARLRFNPKNRGPGYWKLNTQFLKQESYVSGMNNLLDIELSQNSNLTFKKRFELLKLAIRGSSIQYAVHLNKSKSNKREVLERKLKRLEAKCISTNPLFHDVEEQIRKVRHELQEIIQQKAKSAAFRARKNWAENADMPTKYFLSLEKQNFNKKPLHKVMNEKGDLIEDPDEVLQEIKKFYQNLYSTKITPKTDYLEDIDIPKISDDQRAEMDSEITELEVGKALFDLNNNKQCGTDGIPADFYKVFYSKLKGLLHGLMLEIASDGEFHLTAKRGILTLLEKVGKSNANLKSWRPLTMLNSDNKIYTKIMANRLQKVLPTIIHHTQMGFMKEKMVADNIIRIMEALQTCEKEEINGFLVSFDYMKAFDTVEFNSIYNAFEAFGFGDRYIQMIKVIFTEPMLTILNNGYWSEFFTATRGCRQGCCFSPGCFIVLVELLGLGIRQNSRIEGIKIGEAEIKAGQYADDLWSTLKNIESLNNLLLKLDRFYEFSGLTINSEKCAVLKIGPHKNNEASYYTLKKLFWSPKAIKILGIWIYPDPQVIQDTNFTDMLSKIASILEVWKNRRLTLKGKITIINSLVNSLMIHKFLALPTPDQSFFKQYKLFLNSFGIINPLELVTIV